MLTEARATALNLADLVTKLNLPCAISIVLPAAVVDSALAELVPLLALDEGVIGGGNSCYQEDIAAPKRSVRNRFSSSALVVFATRNCPPTSDNHA